VRCIEEEGEDCIRVDGVDGLVEGLVDAHGEEVDVKGWLERAAPRWTRPGILLPTRAGMDWVVEEDEEVIEEPIEEDEDAGLDDGML
jgi:hypothetical protein